MTVCGSFIIFHFQNLPSQITKYIPLLNIKRVEEEATTTTRRRRELQVPSYLHIHPVIMVYPCGPVSHERHHMAIFQEWEAMGLFDVVPEDKTESDCIIASLATNSSHEATTTTNATSAKFSTPPPEIISMKSIKPRKTYVSKAA